MILGRNNGTNGLNSSSKARIIASKHAKKLTLDFDSEGKLLGRLLLLGLLLLFVYKCSRRIAEICCLKLMTQYAEAAWTTRCKAIAVVSIYC